MIKTCDVVAVGVVFKLSTIYTWDLMGLQGIYMTTGMIGILATGKYMRNSRPPPIHRHGCPIYFGERAYSSHLVVVVAMQLFFLVVVVVAAAAAAAVVVVVVVAVVVFKDCISCDSIFPSEI